MRRSRSSRWFSMMDEIGDGFVDDRARISEAGGGAGGGAGGSGGGAGGGVGASTCALDAFTSLSNAETAEGETLASASAARTSTRRFTNGCMFSAWTCFQPHEEHTPRDVSPDALSGFLCTSRVTPPQAPATCTCRRSTFRRDDETAHDACNRSRLSVPGRTKSTGGAAPPRSPA